MHWLVEWLVLTTFTSALAQKPTAPPFVPPDKGPPKDFNNCRLNGLAPMSWVVSVWDSSEKMVVGHGSLLTYIAFVTTCRQYTKSASAYVAHGQTIWDGKNPLNPCMQQKEVETIIKHPNCTKEMTDFPFSDFSVFKLKNPFDIAGHHYPMMALPNSLEDLMDDVAYVNSIADSRGCFLAVFRKQDEQIPVFNLEVSMKIIPFQKKCVKLLCEKNPAESAKCEKQFKKTGRENDTTTMICVKNSTEANIELGKGDSYWLAGAPFFCNGSTYGVASVPVMRQKFGEEKTDFHYVVTFYHVFHWLVHHLKTFAPPWVKVLYLGNRGLKEEGDQPDPPIIPHSNTTTEDFPIPTLFPSAAVRNTPSIVRSLCLISVILLSCEVR